MLTILYYFAIKKGKNSVEQFPEKKEQVPNSIRTFSVKAISFFYTHFNSHKNQKKQKKTKKHTKHSTPKSNTSNI